MKFPLFLLSVVVSLSASVGFFIWLEGLLYPFSGSDFGIDPTQLHNAIVLNSYSNVNVKGNSSHEALVWYQNDAGRQIQAGTTSKRFAKVAKTFETADAPEVLILSVETRRPMKETQLGYSLSLINSSNWIRIANPGEGKVWEGWLSKSLFLREAVKGIISDNPEQIIAVMDTDIFVQDCGNQIVSEYEAIVRETGAEIVFGAELHKYPGAKRSLPRQLVPELPEWAKHNRPQLTDGSLMDYVDNNTYREKGLIYLNAGGYIGRARAVLPMLETVITRMENCTGEDVEALTPCSVMADGNALPQWIAMNDQEQFWWYFVENQDRVTLDYRGRIFQCLSKYSNMSKVYEKDSEGYLWNAWLKEKACFIHLNGGNRQMRHTAREMAQLLFGMAWEDYPEQWVKHHG